MSTRNAEKGSIFVYILASIVLLGALIVTLTSGPQKSGTTVQLDTLVSGLYGDVNAIAAVINECATNYSNPADVNNDGKYCIATVSPPLPGGDACIGAAAADNPNPPFPLYDTAGTRGGFGGSGITLDFATNNLVCPGASPTVKASMPLLFTPRTISNLKILSDTATYAVNYRNEVGANKEGVMLRVTRASSNPLWEEAASRVGSRYSACKAYYVKDGVTDGGACTNGCLFFWIVRLGAGSSVIGATDDSGATCPPA
jgi:hypothetical protein